ncbi:MAG: AraC family transcriptional regulator [Polyangiaceae bacterium]
MHARLTRVIEHIDRHLDEPLDLERLGRLASSSRYYFQRQFRAAFGLSPARYVTLQRLRRAVLEVALRPWIPITDIAFGSGYGSPEAFARAFKRELGQSPSAFRVAPDWARWAARQQPLRHLEETLMTTPSADDVRIVDFPETRVAALEHIGTEAALMTSIRRFVAWRRGHGLPPTKSRTFNVFHADSAGPQHIHYDLCATIDGPLEPNEEGIVEKTLPGGRCAVIRIQGSDAGIAPAFAYLYDIWLAEQGEEARDAPPFAERVAFYPEVSAADAITDLFVPLR